MSDPPYKRQRGERGGRKDRPSKKNFYEKTGWTVCWKLLVPPSGSVPIVPVPALPVFLPFPPRCISPKNATKKFPSSRLLALAAAWGSATPWSATLTLKSPART
jgi:hypothetical protein